MFEDKTKEEKKKDDRMKFDLNSTFKYNKQNLIKKKKIS